MHSFPKYKTRLRDWLQNMNREGSQLATASSARNTLRNVMFVISPSMARSVVYDMKSVRLTEDTIPTIFVKQCDQQFEGKIK